MKRAVLLRPLAAALLAASPAAPAAADSEVSLPAPSVVGNIPAETYDLDGQRVGEAALGFTKREQGGWLLRARTGIEGAARTEMRAELAPDENGGARLLSQRSESHDAEGRSLGVMSIDHERGVATCGRPPGSDDEAVELPLPEPDRVVNVPLNLLFEPLVRGEKEVVEFQLLLCRVRGGRLVDARATVASEAQEEGEGMVEVRYELDLGPILSRLAAPFLPKLSLWFDESSPGGWVGHRMPLFSKGPTVLVVRNGFEPAALNGSE